MKKPRPFSDEEPERSREARDYILWLLGRRDYPRAQLERKLTGRGLAAADAKTLLDTLAEEGLFREKGYGEVRTRQLLRKGLGASLVKSRLRAEKAPVSDSEIREAYERLGSSPREELKVQVEKTLRKLDRRGLAGRELRDKLVRALAPKGHRISDVLSLLEEIESGES
jgi:SOS response regulatory protein OraA/RecX